MLALFVLSKFSLSYKMALLTIIRLGGGGGRGGGGEGGKTTFLYILLYNFLVTHLNFMKFILD